MSVYTAYDMVADCRAGKPEGWLWFARNFVPGLRVLSRHYSAEPEPALARLIATLREELPKQEPAPVREMLVALRPLILKASGYPSAPGVGSVGIETVAEALEPLTIIERQVVWLETMGYDSKQSAVLMRMSAETAAAVREKAGGLLRGKLDDWSITLLCDHGAALGEAVRAAPPSKALPARVYFQSLDGRVTWQQRTEIERELAASWYEIDHFCRVREGDEAYSRTKALEEAEAVPYYALLGVEPAKPGLWKMLKQRA